LANLGILKNVIHIRNTIGWYWKSNHMKSKVPNKSSDTCTVRGIELIDPPLGEKPRPPGSWTRGSHNLSFWRRFDRFGREPNDRNEIRCENVVGEKKCPKIICWSTWSQIWNPHVWVSLVKAFTRLETQSGSAVVHAYIRRDIWKTGKSGYLSYRYLLLSCFFRAQNKLASSLTSNHGVPMGNPHISILVTKSAFTYARKNIHSGGPRNKKCTSSTSTCLSVWAKNILGSSLMIAHDGHTGQTAHQHIRHGAEFH